MKLKNTTFKITAIASLCVFLTACGSIGQNERYGTIEKVDNIKIDPSSHLYRPFSMGAIGGTGVGGKIGSNFGIWGALIGSVVGSVVMDKVQRYGEGFDAQKLTVKLNPDTDKETLAAVDNMVKRQLDEAKDDKDVKDLDKVRTDLASKDLIEEVITQKPDEDYQVGKKVRLRGLGLKTRVKILD